MKNAFNRYFGLWSAKDIRRVCDLLNSIGVRFQTGETETTQDLLQEWQAWDPASTKPHTGYDLWIHNDDLEKVGDQIVTMFPERNF